MFLIGYAQLESRVMVQDVRELISQLNSFSEKIKTLANSSKGPRAVLLTASMKVSNAATIISKSLKGEQ